MAVFKLADEHPLTKAGLRRFYLVETAERGLRLGDVVFEFSFGRVVDTGMACRRDGIIPPAAIERRSHALTTGRVARSEHALKQRLQVPYADTRSSPAPAGTGLVKFVRLGGQAAFAVA